MKKIILLLAIILGLGGSSLFAQNLNKPIEPMEPVDPVLEGGTIAPETQTIDSGGVPAMLTNVDSASGGWGEYSYWWEQSLDGQDWTSLSDNVLEYSPPALTTTTYFRRCVSSSPPPSEKSKLKVTQKACSNIAKINVTEEQLQPGKISGDQTIKPESRPLLLISTTASGGTGSYSYQWQSSTDNSTWWNILNAKSTKYWPGKLTETTYFRLRVQSGSQTKYSNVVTITVSNLLQPGEISGNQTITSGSTPEEIKSQTSASGGDGSVSYQWQDSPDESNWTDIPNATNMAYQPGVLSATTYYRRQAKTKSTTVNSNVVTITVVPKLSSGAISGNQTILSGITPAPITNVTSASGGIGDITYQWLSSPDNVIWTGITNAKSEEYQPGAKTATASTTTYYRRQATDSSETVYTESVSITVEPNLKPGAIAGEQIILSGKTPATLTSTAPASGGIGDITYQWQSSPDNSTWVDITSAKSETYTPATMTVTETTTTYYRRQATAESETVHTESVSITVEPNLQPGEIRYWYEDQVVVSGEKPALIILIEPASGGIGVIYYQWQISYDNLDWQDLTDATSDDYYEPPALTRTSSFRIQAIAGSETVYSNVITITVTLNAGSISGDQTILSGVRPSTITNTESASGGSETISYRWQSRSSTSSTWTNIANAKSEEYRPAAKTVTATTTTYYRRQATVGSETAYTEAVSITVEPKLQPGAIAENQIILSGKMPVTLTSTAPAAGGIGAISYQWLSSPDNSTWSTITNATAEEYQPPVTTVTETTTTHYCRQAKAGSETIQTKSVSITVEPNLQPGWIFGGGTIISGETPILLNGESASGGLGTIRYFWQDSYDGYTWSDIANANEDSYDPGALEVTDLTTIYYRRSATAGEETVYADSISYTIVPVLLPGSISESQTILSGMTPSTIMSTESASGGYPRIDYQWQEKTDSSNWKDIPRATNGARYSPGALTATAHYRRRAKDDYQEVYSNTVTVTVKGMEEVAGVISRSDISNKTRGLKTHEKVAVVDGDNYDNITYVERVFFYDYRGRVIQTVEKNHLGSISRYSTKYDFVGNVLASHESHQISETATADTKLTIFEYDPRGRMLSETTCLNDGRQAKVTYAYDELGKLKNKSYGETAYPYALTETFSYNIQGWLTEQSSDLFEMQLKYFNPRTDSLARYAGDITEWRWQHKGHNAPATTLPANSYEFAYDKLSRLLSNNHMGATSITDTSWNTPSKTFAEAMTYDRNGNITTLSRQGYHATSGSPTLLTDNLVYTYTGNQLTSLSHNNASGSVKVSGSKTYAYDANGNMTTNEREGLEYGYNYLNLLGNVTSGSTVKATYRWLADGTKAGVKTPAGTAGYEYLGSLIYTRNSTGGLDLESVGFGGGRVEVSKDIDDNRVYATSYHLTDHLGSVRVAFKDKNTVSARNDFYPFGKPHVNNLMPMADDQRNRWLYNGKENQLTGDLRFLDYGARMYDSEIARWTTPDPLLEKYYRWSPYAYVGNNPLRFFDPDGRRRWPVNSTYNNLTPRSLNNFGASRPNNRTHQGVDINFGSGNQDLGAPVLATHNGTVTRMVTIGNGDTDAGGNRIVITSDDGVVSTSYMHLEGITEGLTEGSIITEGQQIGTIGGTGNGSTDAYAPHLHYEVRLDGVVQNPENTDGTLMDPQAHIILDGGTLEPVSVDTQGNPPVRVEIPIPLPLPEDLSRQVL